jgi:hypothetical protein
MATRFDIHLVDIDDVEALKRAIDAVARLGKTRYIRRGERVVAIVEPTSRQRLRRSNRSQRRHRAPAGGAFGMSDPIWKIVGMAGDAFSSDIAKYKDEYIAEALMEEFE